MACLRRRAILARLHARLRKPCLILACARLWRSMPELLLQMSMMSAKLLLRAGNSCASKCLSAAKPEIRMPLNVLHLLWGLETGGVQRLIATLAQFSPDTRARHSIAAFHGGSAELLLREAGCKVWLLHKRAGIDPALPRRLRTLLDEVQPDILHAHDFTGAFWGLAALKRAARRAFVVSDHLAFQKLGFPKRVLYCRCLEKADAVVVLSEPTRKGLAAAGVSPEKLTRLWIGPNLEPLPVGFNRAALRKELALDEGDMALLACARLEKQKNLLWLVRLAACVARKDQRLRFFIAGEGSMKQRLQQEIAKLNIPNHCALLGLRRDVNALMAAADVFVLPSLLEELPLAALEAMAAGLPIAAAPAGALPELLEASGAGRVMGIDGFAPWENWLLELANRPDLRAEPGRRGCEFVNAQLNPAHGVAEMLALYDKLL